MIVIQHGKSQCHQWGYQINQIYISLDLSVRVSTVAPFFNTRKHWIYLLLQPVPSAYNGTGQLSKIRSGIFFGCITGI